MAQRSGSMEASRKGLKRSQNRRADLLESLQQEGREAFTTAYPLVSSHLSAWSSTWHASPRCHDAAVGSRAEWIHGRERGGHRRSLPRREGKRLPQGPEQLRTPPGNPYTACYSTSCV